MNRGWRYIDWYFLCSCLLLLFFGMSALYSLSLESRVNYFERQLFFAILGGIIFFVLLTRVSISEWRRHAQKGFWLIFALLLLTLLIGHEINGAKRWLNLGFISLQPAEFFKLFLILCIARWSGWAIAEHELGLSIFARMFARLLLPMMVIILQPDFGTLVMLLAVVFVMFFLSGMRLLWLSFGFVSGLVLLVWLVISKPYRLQRVEIFLNPFSDPYGKGYSQLHSLMAFENGGNFGVGLGHSVEKQYLPEIQNDFIMAIIAEEWGLFGFLMVCALFLFLIARTINIACQAEERGEFFGALYAFGLSALLSFQVIVNIGGSLSILPSKGFTLPLVSYGGSSLWVTLAMFAVLLRLGWENRFARMNMRGYHA